MVKPQEIEARVKVMMQEPKFPFWLLLKLLWLEIRGIKVHSFDLCKPYEIRLAK